MDRHFLIDGTELEDSFVNCTKNPGHNGFIPMKNCLALNDDFKAVLPNIYQNDTYIKFLIQYLSKLTVNVQSYKEGKPLSGTGFIHSVIIYSNEEPSGINCRCKPCQCSLNPKQVRGEVHVRTANHNIYDLNYGTPNIICRLFYSDENCISSYLVCSDLKNRKESSDTVILVCKTCELQLLKDLKGNLDGYKELKSTLNRKFINRTKTDVIAIIVSHPHSQYQHVTVGPLNPHKREIIIDGSFVDQYIYRTLTCEGCSGAFVCQVGGNIESEACVHIGIDNDDTKLSYGNIYKDNEDIPANELFFQMLNN